ncbi:NUDIX domain-containing protein [Streptomyces sp. 8K308]|uniref:NUDIX domain-containing protein n=1 Tax=Streptomyces sp. 8K308 TaxID=2530388 RepID=UPI00104297C7|nr:NUDIX domain-containing protein [Streptomyces sp. 8K308]TDC27590.1 NUDIX domain-containing protein [Streptomyces sp. 8K308]
MTDTTRPLATGPLGVRLLAFDRLPEGSEFGDAPVGYCLVAVERGGRVLLVLDRGRGCWELPGGGIEPGETPRQAAARELWEEARVSIPPEELRFAGFALTAFANKPELRGAIFRAALAEAEEPAPFSPNEEISAITWWDGGEPPQGGQLQLVDTYLAELLTEPGRPQPA